MDLKKTLEAISILHMQVGKQALNEKNVPIKVLLNSICYDLNQVRLKIDGVDKIAKITHAQEAAVET